MGLEAIFEPVGPLPTAVYWWRRAIALGLAILVVLLASKACGGGGSKKPVALHPSPSTPAAPSSAAPTGSTATAQPCEDTQLSLSVAVNGTKFPSGAPPKLSLVITNTGPNACSRDMGLAQRGFVVTTGNVRAWSSTDCQSPTPIVQTLKVNEPVQLVLEWNRHLSDPSCSANTAQKLAANGGYAVTGVLGALRKLGPAFTIAP